MNEKDLTRDQLVEELQKLKHQLEDIKVKKLAERVKELNCLYGISTLIEKSTNVLEDILKGAVILIPPSWQYPEITCARIAYKSLSFFTPKFEESPWKLSHEIIVFGKPEGSVDIFYKEQRPTLDIGPFLNEEKKLIQAIAERLAKSIEWAETDKKLKASLQEKDLLLQELHHRVKNNLQVISGLITLQMSRINDSKYLPIFKDFQTRIKTMALTHEQLYYSDNLDQLKLAAYFDSLVKNIFQTFQVESRKIKYVLSIPSLPIPLDTVLNCGLITNELVTNALKHAFKEQASGQIAITLSPTEQHTFLLEITDNGSGFRYDLENQSPETLGLYLVKMLVKKMKGIITFDQIEGTKIKIEWPDQS